MPSLKAALGGFGTTVTKSVGVSTTVIGIFLYHAVFDKDLECACEDQTSICWCYMVLPAFIILFMLLWLDGSFQVLLKSCLKGTERFRGFLWLWIFRAFLISLLWPVSVLIDGDWYVCCGHQWNLFCRDSYQTAADIMSIKELKVKSRVIGFGVLLGIVLVAAISRFPWKECCTRCGLNECCTCHALEESFCCCLNEFVCCCCLDDCCTCESDCLNKDDLFKKIVLEEGESLVTNKLIEVAKGKIDKKINEYAAAGEWGKCYGVVEEITSAPQHDNNPDPPPGGSSSAEGRGNGDETQPMVQPLIDGSPSGSSPKEAQSSV